MIKALVSINYEFAIVMKDEDNYSPIEGFRFTEWTNYIIDKKEIKKLEKESLKDARQRAYESILPHQRGKIMKIKLIQYWKEWENWGTLEDLNELEKDFNE